MIVGRKLSATGLIGRAISGRFVGLGDGGAADPISILGAKLAAWYTSDPSTMFTTSTGETPVTAAGEPVGLRLDKSKGMELGGNKSPLNEVTVAASGDSEAFVTGDVISLRRNTSGATSATYSQSLAVGKLYDVTFTVTDVPGYSTIMRLTSFGSLVVSGPGTRSFKLLATNTLLRFDNPGYGHGVDVTNFVVREIAGNHAYQTTPTARPFYQVTPQRIVYDPDDALNITLPAISGGQIVISSPVGIWIDSLDFAGGTFSLGPTTYTGGPAGLWSILGNSEMQVCILDDAMTSEEQTALVAYLVAQGSPGLITLGAELRPNSFDDGTWQTLATGASISAGVLSFVDVAPGNVGAAQSLANGSPYNSAKKFLTTLTISNYSSGGVRLWTGAGYSPTFTSNGVHSAFAINPADTTLRVYAPQSGANSTLDATISIREVTLP